MGKGKGLEYYACRVKPGRIIFEIDELQRNCKNCLI